MKFWQFCEFTFIFLNATKKSQHVFHSNRSTFINKTIQNLLSFFKVISKVSSLWQHWYNVPGKMILILDSCSAKFYQEKRIYTHCGTCDG